MKAEEKVISAREKWFGGGGERAAVCEYEV